MSLKNIEREPDGEREETLRNYEFERSELAGWESCWGDYGSVRYHQPGDITGPTWSYPVGASDECAEKRSGRGKAPAWMPYGSAEGATSRESDASHSTPKGCAEDMGVLRGVMC
jgi:hypothetical protein